MSSNEEMSSQNGSGQHLPEVTGAACGCVATLPMSAAMAAAYCALPWSQQYSLPPRQITMTVAKAAGVASEMSESERNVATAAAHFGYGAAMGAIYGTFTRQGVAPSIGTGVAFGMAVWAGSYLGLLPAMRLMSPATQHPVERTLLMIGAHVVWGAALGSCMQRLDPHQGNPHQGNPHQRIHHQRNQHQRIQHHQEKMA
jgi:uncharacterized membrane protein YagU involved in acid resistance